MAQKVQVLLIDDFDGGEADETIQFGLDGVVYEIDLSTVHANELRDVLNDYVDAGRRVGRVPAANKPAPTNTSGPVNKTGVTKQDRASIRNWAEQNDMMISDRGRIAQSIIDGWKEAGSPRLEMAADE